MALFSATTLAVASLATAAVGTGLQAYGQYQQGKTAARVADYNARQAEQQALQTEMDATETIRRKREQDKRLLATQRTRYAASGVVQAGTPLEVMAESASLLEMETLDYARQQGQRATAMRTQAISDRIAGRDAFRAGRIGAGTSLLTGFGSMAGNAAQFKNTGII